MPFDFGIGEIAIVLLIGLLVFGPKRLPEISRSVGKGMNDLRRGMSGELDDTPAAATAGATEAPAPAAAPTPAPAAPATAAPAAAAAAPVAAAAEAPSPPLE